MLPSSAEGGETLRASNTKFGKEREREREAKDSLDRVSGRKTFPSEILSGFYEALRPPFIFIAPCYGMKSSVFIAPTYFWTVEGLERIFLFFVEYYLNL